MIEEVQKTMPETIKIKESTVNLIKGDLTQLDVEAIVFYAKPDLALGSGYGNAISTRGGPSIKEELTKIGGAKVEESVVTGAGALNARYIIHAVGPAFQEENTAKKLRNTIANALKTAESKGITQVAFPIMGAGFYGVPYDVSIGIMYECIKSHLSNNSQIKELIICANDNRELKLLASKASNLN
jgi:O-acetyl-ADP-ribose deacetylase